MVTTKVSLTRGVIEVKSQHPHSSCAGEIAQNRGHTRQNLIYIPPITRSRLAFGSGRTRSIRLGFEVTACCWQVYLRRYRLNWVGERCVKAPKEHAAQNNHLLIYGKAGRRSQPRERRDLPSDFAKPTNSTFETRDTRLCQLRSSTGRFVVVIEARPPYQCV
jgi:hypothetical protein